MKSKVYLLEDDDTFAFTVQWKIDQGTFYEIEWFKDHHKMMSELRRGGKPVAFVLDDKLIGTTGLDVVTMLREEGYDEPIIFLSSNKDIQRSVDIVRQGVESYIVKGEDCIEQLEDCLYKLN